AESRQSRDTPSLSTAAESEVSSLQRDSLERSHSRTPSEIIGGTPNALTPQLSNTQGGSKDGKETFMQRLSRKTSATGSKLKTPFSKDREIKGMSGLFSSGR